MTFTFKFFDLDWSPIVLPSLKDSLWTIEKEDDSEIEHKLNDYKGKNVSTWWVTKERKSPGSQGFIQINLQTYINF